MIIAPDGGDAWAPAKPRPDEALIRAVVRAHRWKRMLDDGRYRSAGELADAEGVTRSFVNRLLRLTLLAPRGGDSGGTAAESGAVAGAIRFLNQSPDDYASLCILERRRHGGVRHREIGVIGIGLMGSGIAQVSATYGFDTVVADMSDEVVQRGMARIEDSLSKLVASYDRSKGQRGMASAQRDAALAKLHGTSYLQELLDCDLIIEAVTENYAVKAALYEHLSPSRAITNW